MFILRLENIIKIYNENKKDKVEALKNINMTLPDNGLVFITGASGSGKSTLLNLIGLLDYPTDGIIKFASSVASKYDNTRGLTATFDYLNF